MCRWKSGSSVTKKQAEEKPAVLTKKDKHNETDKNKRDGIC